MIVLPWRVWARLLDATERKPLPAPLASLLSSEHDGREIRLTLYTERSTVSTVALDPVRAVGIAGESIKAASPRLRAS